MPVYVWKTWYLKVCALGLLVAVMPQRTVARDLRDAAPPGVMMAVYARHNPDHDYQKEDYKAVWEEIRTAKLHEKIL